MHTARRCQQLWRITAVQIQFVVIKEDDSGLDQLHLILYK